MALSSVNLIWRAVKKRNKNVERIINKRAERKGNGFEYVPPRKEGNIVFYGQDAQRTPRRTIYVAKERRRIAFVANGSKPKWPPTAVYVLPMATSLACTLLLHGIEPCIKIL
jgi:hypothetical protein